MPASSAAEVGLKANGPGGGGGVEVGGGDVEVEPPPQAASTHTKQRITILIVPRFAAKRALGVDIPATVIIGSLVGTMPCWQRGVNRCPRGTKA